ncbi:phage antirepressor N-terminal domain-containing protein [Haemophilus parahaemolyticus]|uniref:phage antirepressor N-terminal domain-containing protein n=1 Tax=Haemophilus parahaemolyticus TaxID=735 RepID=UPI002491F42E|nr:phage antirepressor N-terminal domain-containing protein [Haemophilus parahaemolyticus]
MSNQITTQTLSFHGSDLITLKVEDVIYTAVKPIVEAMGLDWGGQQQKLSKSGDKFNCRDISMVAKDGKIRQMLCMPLKKLNGWLFSINPEKVRADLREKVIQYQEECFEALYNYWHLGKAERTINPEQQQAIQEAVVKAHHRTGMSYAEIYRQLKSLFKVGKYDQLKPSQFENAISFLATLGNSYAPIDRMDNLELTEQEWLDWQNFYYAVTRFSESVETLIHALRSFRSHQQNSVEFNLDVVQRYIRTTNPAVRKINDRINRTNRRPLAIGHYNESATSVAVFK